MSEKINVFSWKITYSHKNVKHFLRMSKAKAPNVCSDNSNYPTPRKLPKTHMLCSFHDTSENFLSCSIERFNPSVFSLGDDYAERKVFFMQVQYLIFFLVAVAQQLLSLPSAPTGSSYRRSFSLQAAALVWWCKEGEGIFIKHEL